MEILKEMKWRFFLVWVMTPKVHCRVFEDNSGALEMATTHKYRPRTKKLKCETTPFLRLRPQGKISIHPVDSAMQQADYLTKPGNHDILSQLRPSVMRW
jgi:hypothetical protein